MEVQPYVQGTTNIAKGTTLSRNDRLKLETLTLDEAKNPLELSPRPQVGFYLTQQSNPRPKGCSTHLESKLIHSAQSLLSRGSRVTGPSVQRPFCTTLSRRGCFPSDNTTPSPTPLKPHARVIILLGLARFLFGPMTLHIPFHIFHSGRSCAITALLR